MIPSTALYDNVLGLLLDNCPKTADEFEDSVPPSGDVLANTNRFLRGKLCGCACDTRQERLALDDNANASVWCNELESVFKSGLLN